jgi:hypothetical protein
MENQMKELKSYLVGIKFNDCDIDLQMVASPHWKNALLICLVNIGHEQKKQNADMEKTPELLAIETVGSLSDDLEQAKQDAFDQDWEFNIKEI